MKTNNISSFVPGDTIDVSLNIVVVEMLKLIKCPTDVFRQGVEDIIKWIKDTYGVNNIITNTTIGSGVNNLYTGYIHIKTIASKPKAPIAGIILTSHKECVEIHKGYYNIYLNNLYNIHLLYSCAYVLTNILNKTDYESK